MGRARKDREVEEDDKDERDEEPDEALIARDYVMARLAGAVASLDAAKASVIEALNFFVSPDDDKKGKLRTDAIETATEAASCALRGLEEAIEEIDDADLESGEPFDEEEED